jgi:hypothetical protein
MAPVVLYHVTTTPQALRILAGGFKNDSEMNLTRGLYTGVRFSDHPPDPSEVRTGDTVLKVTFDCSIVRLAEFEVVEFGKVYREWLIPAAFANVHAITQLAG